MHSALSVQLFVEANSIGALDLYGAEPHAFTAEDENLALLIAAHAAIAVTAVAKVENLSVALNSRDLIGQAKGVLMERYRVTAEEAFQLMVLSSQATGRKLRVIADELTQTGELAVPRRPDAR